MANKDAFDIPDDVRKLAESSVSQAQKAFEDLITAAKRTTATMEASGEAVKAGAEEIGKGSVAFAHHNVMASFEFAQKLSQARDMDEITRLQREFLQSQMEAAQSELARMNEVVARTGQAAMRTKG